MVNDGHDDDDYRSVNRAESSGGDVWRRRRQVLADVTSGSFKKSFTHPEMQIVFIADKPFKKSIQSLEELKVFIFLI